MEWYSTGSLLATTLSLASVDSLEVDRRQNAVSRSVSVTPREWCLPGLDDERQDHDRQEAQ
jgi:hypothetical protein